MIKWLVAGTTSCPKYLNTWHLLFKAFYSKFLIKATQSHNLVSAWYFKSDHKELHYLIPNNRDCYVVLTLSLRIILRLKKQSSLCLGLCLMFEALHFSILLIVVANLAIVDQANQRSRQKIKFNDTIKLKIWIKIKVYNIFLY